MTRYRVCNSIDIDGSVFLGDLKTKRIVAGVYLWPWLVKAYCRLKESV